MATYTKLITWKILKLVGLPTQNTPSKTMKWETHHLNKSLSPTVKTFDEDIVVMKIKMIHVI